MLSFALVLGFLAAVNCVHETTVQDVNALVDSTIAEVRKETLKLAELPGVTVTGLESLKRDGDCLRTFKKGAFGCKVVSEKARVSAEGEHADITIHVEFEVIVDDEGHLVKYTVQNTEIDIQEPKVDTFYKISLKKIVKKLKKVIKEALHTLISKKVKEIVVSIATSIMTGG